MQKSSAQFSNEIFNYDYRIDFEKSISSLDYDEHTAMKPLLVSDRVFSEAAENEKSRFYYSTFNSERKIKLAVLPLLSLGASKDFSLDTFFLSMGAGIRTDISYNEKWNASVDYYSENASYPGYVGNYIEYTKVIPGMGDADNTSLGYSFSRASGFIAFTPDNIFEIKAGVGKNFIGDGYRSLLLSDNAFQYPYLRINSTFWKLRYTNLYCMLDDIRTNVGFASNPVRKFTTIHFLDWNISKRMNIGVFESVVWQSKDTLYNRGFDINYLNPVIFYRSVEYSLGSSDNSIMGLNAKLKINGTYQLYAQFVLDEFLLKEVMDGRGWWGNKYGVQIGAKAVEPFKLKNLFIQSEFNIVRPFTFSHGSVLQNYGHHNQPLAHPLGANFWESVSLVRYRWKDFVISNQTNIALYGTDTTGGTSYGGDIYRSYQDRDGEYYHRIGQGISNHLFYNRISLSWILDPEINLRIELSHVYRRLENQIGTDTRNFIMFSLRTNLWNSYTDF